MNYILLQKQEQARCASIKAASFQIVTKSLNQNVNIKAEKSDEIQPMENFENSAVAFDDTLLSTHASKIDLFFFCEKAPQ